MKNYNLIEWLGKTDSHEKQSPQRFARYAAMLIMLLTLGVGQMWADNGDFYNVSMSYKFEDNDWAWIEGSDNGTGESRDVGTLSSGTLKVGDVYLKCWDDWGSNFKSEGGQMCYTNKGGDTQYLTGFTRSSKYGNEGNNYDYHKTSCDLTIASYDQASGSFALECWYQTWGSNWGDRYFPKSSGHYTLNYKIAPPAVKEGNNFTVTPSNLISGTGTSSDPFIIAYGSSTTFKVTATKHHTDANSKLKVSWNNGSTWSTGSTASTTELTSSSFTPDGTKRSITIKVKFNNSTASLDGAVSSRTIYYIQQTPGLTVAAGSHGKVRKSTGDSWTTSALISPVAASTAYNIYANPDTHYDFGSWTSSDDSHTTFGNSTSASTTATLSAGYGAVTTVTANFVEHPYTITIVGGTAASTTAKVATTGTATAKAPFGMHFTGWTVPNSNFTLVGCTTSDVTITFYATAAGTVTANFEQTHAYIEGRFHIWNPSRSGNWTNTFNSGDWQEDSRNIEFSYDAVNHDYYLHTYAKPSELTSQISNLDPWFFIKSSPSTSNWTGATVNRPHASGDSNQQLTAAGEANKKSADGTSGSNSFRFNSSDQSGYVVIGFKKFGVANDPYIYYWLEQRLQYNGNSNTGGSAPSGTYGNNTYHTTNASITAPANTYTKTGYSFAGWKKNNVGALISAGSSVTMDADVTLYAQWTENTHNVSVSANAGGSVSPSGTVAVKQVTGTSITATPDADHAFLNWSISGGGITPTSSSTKTQTFKATTTGGTIAANFQNRWIMKGSGGVFGDWNTDKELSKSATNTYSTTLALVAGTAYSFKVYDRHTAKWYGKTSTTITKDVGELTKNIAIVEGAGNTYNLHFTPAVSGNYTFTYNSSTGNLTIGWPDVNQLQIYTAPGHAAAVGNWDWTSTAGSVSSKTFTLNKNTRYTFKVVYHSDFYGFNNNSDMTIDDNTNWRLYDESVGAGYQNANMYSPVAGSYTFSFNSDYVSGSDHLTVISVTYPTAYTITFGAGAINGSNSAISASASPSFSSGDYVLAETDVTFSKGTTKTGYNWKGWYSNNDGTGTCHSSTDGSLSWTATRTGNISVYACYTYKTYTVTLDMQSSAEGYGSGSNRNVTTTYNTTLPSAGALPTAANGYAFMGFYTATGGRGTRFIDASGNWATSVTDTISAGKWVLDAGTTLYAYYKKAEITALTLDATVVATNGTVGVTPTVSPTPVGDTKLCFYVFHNNDNPLDPQPEITWNGTKATFNAGETSGTYKIGVSLRTGTSCGGGTLLDSTTISYQVAGTHSVTVRYKCGDEVIKAASSLEGIRPLDWSDEITAPDIIGYSFTGWSAGDGVSLTDDNGTTTKTSTTEADIKIKAIYDGYLTANYSKKRVIYFNNTLNWENVYVYFYSGSYWNNDNGTGSNTGGSYTGINGQMQPISEGSKIYYFDAEAAGVNASYTYVSFTELHQNNTEFFEKTGTTKNKVIYRSDYKSTTLPMFVPVANQTPESKHSNQADYYNKGYWMNYPENTGYTLRIYDTPLANNATGASREFLIPFSEDVKMPLKQEVEVNFSGESWFIIYRNDGTYLEGSHTFKQTDHGDKKITSTADASKAKKMRLISDGSGIYTFTLTFRGDGGENYDYYLNVDFPAAVGDYRIVYSDNATWSNGAHSAGWYHPSDIIGKNTSETEAKEDTVSFFISHGSSPSMKFQRISAISESAGSYGKITWEDVPSGSITIPTSITASGVYNFIVTQPAGGASISLVKAEPYTGNYYIRTDCAGETKWNNFRSPDHLITYSEYSITHGGYSHYYAHWVQTDDKKNIQFCIANDYSSAISDTLIRENNSDPAWTNINNYIDEKGNILRNANVRFMWNQSTNKVSRSYVDGAQGPGSNNFLYILNTDSPNKIRWSAESALTSNKVTFADNGNWIYEANIQAQPNAKIRLLSNWGETNTITQYFKGSSSTTEDLVGGSGTTWYDIRVIYDFKTNRLVASYIPRGEIDDQIAINADVMFIREHQGQIDQLTFKEKDEKMGAISAIKTAYGVLRLNKWTLNNKEKTGTHEPLASPKSRYERDLFYISFPFRVAMEEVFGFGTYGTHWIIEEYDGASRAANGYWQESGPNWKFVFNRKNKFFEPYQGYVIALDLDELGESSSVWANTNQVELYFPSYGTMPDITNASVNCTIPEHLCTINRSEELGGNGTPLGSAYDRRVKDSHWNVISVPTYVNTSNITFANTDWITTADDTHVGPNFLYEWNPDDNSVTARSGVGYTYAAMHAYLVQYCGVITWSSSVSPAAAPRRNPEYRGEYEFRLEMLQNGEAVDQTFVKLSDNEAVTTGFEFNYDLSKEFNNSKSNIYTLIGTEQVAGNVLPLTEQTTIVPVGVIAKTNGDYTFSMPDGTEGIGITLVDTETGIRTILSALDYTVNLAAGTYDNRFFLEISPIVQTPTDVEEVTGDGLQVTGARKVIIDQKMFIIKDGKIYDAQGRQVK